MCTHYSIKTGEGSYVSFEWDRIYNSYNMKLHSPVNYKFTDIK